MDKGKKLLLLLRRILSLLSCMLAVLLIALGLLGKNADDRAARIPGALNESPNPPALLGRME